jgi:myo-inositol-1(or 4)-monophosphatase
VPLNQSPLWKALNDSLGNGSSRSGRLEDLQRIGAALQAAEVLLRDLGRQRVDTTLKANGDPVTTADRAANELLLRMLPRGDEGWLSEESADDDGRLGKRRVWIVDPLDGTKEFLAGIPEWCVSIALIEGGEAVAGGICNPATGETFIGSRETGVHYCPLPQPTNFPERCWRPTVLASRSEVKRGEWDWLRDSPFDVRPVGSVAYKLALVAAGRADTTWTLTPKSEWDVAAGVALVLAAGGTVRRLNSPEPVFNQMDTRWEGLVAFSASAATKFGDLFETWLSHRR